MANPPNTDFQSADQTSDRTPQDLEAEIARLRSDLASLTSQFSAAAAIPMMPPRQLRRKASIAYATMPRSLKNRL